MKQIQPIQQTNQGNEATQIIVTILNDNGIDFCYFQWYLYDINGLYVNNGMIFCGYEDYTNWNHDDIYPYTFVANILSITLV